MAGMVTPIVQSTMAWSAAAAPPAQADDLSTIKNAIVSTVTPARRAATLQAAGLIGAAVLTQQQSFVEADSATGDASLGIRTYYEQLEDRFDPAEGPVIFGLRDDVATIGSFWI